MRGVEFVYLNQLVVHEFMLPAAQKTCRNRETKTKKRKVKKKTKA